jgi:hypothetical protein
LISRCVVPDRSASSASRRAFARRSSSLAELVALTVDWIPPVAYFPPRIRVSNSSVRSPAKTRCMAVDEPRDHRATDRVDPRPFHPVRHLAGGSDPGDPIAVDDHGCVSDDAEHPAPRRVVRHELADAIDEH